MLIRIKEHPHYFAHSEGLIWSQRSQKFIKPVVHRDGYHRLSICEEGSQLSRSIHRLVAIAHIPNPENKREINHKNGDKADNRVENLEWCTRAENMQHARDNGFRTNLPKGEAHHKAKINEEIVRAIRASTETGKVLGDRYGLNRNTVNGIKRGKTWKHVI